MGDLGVQAERRTEERIRAALPGGARCYPNVAFVARTRHGGPAHDGEADLVIVHPEHGLLVVEVKSGEPSRDAAGRWYLGGTPLERSPFDQAKANKHDLARNIAALADGPREHELRRGHAVAFPFADLATLPRGHALLGPDVDRELILDAEALATPESTARALQRVWAYWTGDGSAGATLTPAQLAAIDEYLAPAGTIRRLVRRDLDEARDRLLQASRAQLIVLNQERGKRRMEVEGPAGSGKSLVAVEKARRLAREGFRTLFVCFNQPLATSVLRSVIEDDEPEDRRPLVATFHGLCELLGRAAGTLPPKPSGAERLRAWFDEGLPQALAAALVALPDRRFHAIVVDEGQDFTLEWLRTLERLLLDPADGILWIFHDPGQALYRDDVVAQLPHLDHLELFEDYRSPAPVAELAAGFYTGPVRPEPVMAGGRDPVVVVAEPGRDTVEAVRRQLHRLTEIEQVRAWDIVVLSARSASASDVWRQRRFGNLVLWNGAIADDGSSLALPADQVPDEPGDADVVLFETIRRFKGLERQVVVLCELPEAHDRLEALLYTGLTRSTAHLVVITPPALAPRFRR